MCDASATDVMDFAPFWVFSYIYILFFLHIEKGIKNASHPSHDSVKPCRSMAHECDAFLKIHHTSVTSVTKSVTRPNYLAKLDHVIEHVLRS